MTTGNGFEGYHVEKYLGIISKEIIFRSGLGSSLGAAIENFVRAFNFDDVELTGSTELIANAKIYLMEQFEHEANMKRANAVLGVDIETSFGTDVARVAVSGTAVFVVKDDTTSVDVESDGVKSVNVHATNISNPLLISSIELSTGYSANTVAVEVKQTEKGELGDIKADLLMRNRFDDEFLIENVCFIGFQQKSNKHFISTMTPISIPDYISRCIKSCNVVVKKYFFNGELCIPENLDVKERTAIIEEIDKGPDVEAIFENLSQLNKAQEMIKALETMDLDHESEPYITLAKTLQSRFQLEKMYGTGGNRTLDALRKAIDGLQ